MKSKARYLMIGGFLGAGKTTAILRIAQTLRAQNLRVGLITNDQSRGLVDTAMLSSNGFSVEEITGGCFCCRFNSLADASQRLVDSDRPDIFIAEPVGSCTDLKATVDYPLRRLYGENFAIAPLSVVVDPIRASHILGLETGKSFSKKVIYIYRKQLEEAEIIAVNKIDLIAPGKLNILVEKLRSEFPNALVLAVSARQGTGFSEWISQLESGVARIAGAMDVDYDTYAEGEALLGWLNCTAMLEAASLLNFNAAILDLANAIQRRLRNRHIEIAHLKLTFTPDEGNDIAVANLVRTDGKVELSHLLNETAQSGQLILNLRAEDDPDQLRSVVSESLAECGRDASYNLEVEHMESFRPGRPTPTHRLTEV